MNDLRERYDFLFDGSGDLTQETLLLYVFGPLENEARQAVEQHLDECEMCRDAAEGMALLGTKEQALAALAVADAKLMERVEALKQKVTRDGKEALITQSAAKEPVQLKAEKPQRRIGWYRYAAAASVIVVVGIAFWWFNQNMVFQSEDLAMKQEDSMGLFENAEPPALKQPIEAPEGIDNADTGTAPTDDEENLGASITVAPNGGIGTYTYKWDEKTSSDEIIAKESTKPGTYTVTVTDANCCDTQPELTANKQAPAATKPAPPAPSLVQADDVADIDALDLEEQEDPLVVGEMNTDGVLKRNAKQKDAIVATDTISLNNTNASYGFVSGRTSADQPTAVDKGTSNSNFTLNNAANMTLTDASVNQAEYPGGMDEVQKYFDKATYPTGTTKGYKGVIILEVHFDEQGKIMKSTIIQGLGNPYDVVILNHLKKMPNWEAPAPYGEPFKSARLVTVEVTVR